MPSCRSKKPSCQKAFRKKDQALLMRIAEGEPGNLWRSPMLEAMKRAGATVHMDDNHRLQVTFREHTIHPRRLDLGLAEDSAYQTTFGQQLRQLAQALLVNKKPNAALRCTFPAHLAPA